MFIDPRAARETFGSFARRWVATKADVHTATLENIEGRIRTDFEHFAAMPLGSIKASDVLAWRAAASGARANDTINAALGTLRQILRLAVLEGIIASYPGDGVRPLPAGPRKEIHPATPEQVAALADALDPRYRAAILFDALGSGLRAGELWALRAQRVDFLRRTVRVVESVSETKGGLITKAPKNGRARTVRLDAETVELLSRHVRDFPGPFLFTSAGGAQIRHRNFMPRRFLPALRSLGEAMPPGFRFHDLRHTHASTLIAQGWRPEQICDRLGHGSIRTTYDWYGHLFDGHDDEQLDALGEMVRGAVAPNLPPRTPVRVPLEAAEGAE